MRNQEFSKLLTIIVLAGVGLVFWRFYNNQPSRTPPLVQKASVSLNSPVEPVPAVTEKPVYSSATINESSDPALIENTYYSIIYNNDASCTKKEYFGSKGDGGYSICMDPGVGLEKGNCVIYSFGINNEWSFDDDIVSKYECKLFAFDPTMGKPEHERGKFIKFYPIGLSKEDTDTFMGKHKAKTLGSIIKMLGHENTKINILKIDIEYSEYDVLEKAFKDNILPGNVMQIVLESHTVLEQSKQMVRRAQIMNQIHSIGFGQWSFRDNVATPKRKSPFTGKSLICCVEHFFIKTDKQLKS